MDELQNFLLVTICDMVYGKGRCHLIVAIQPETFKRVKIEQAGKYGRYELEVVPGKENFEWHLPELKTTVLFVFNDYVPSNKIWVANTHCITEITTADGKETNTLP